MHRPFQWLTRSDAAFAGVTALLLAVNVYYGLLLNAKEGRAWELNTSLTRLSEEHAACFLALNKATGKTWFVAKDEDGEYYLTYWD